MMICVFDALVHILISLHIQDRRKTKWQQFQRHGYVVIEINMKWKENDTVNVVCFVMCTGTVTTH